MTEQQAPQFDTSLAQRRLLSGVVSTVIGLAVLLAAMMFFVDRADWWRGYIAATIASVLAAAASIVPLKIGLTKSYSGLVSAFMISSGVRAVIALGIAAFAVGVGKYPPVPTLLLVVPYYFALLAVETWILVRTLKK